MHSLVDHIIHLCSQAESKLFSANYKIAMSFRKIKRICYIVCLIACFKKPRIFLYDGYEVHRPMSFRAHIALPRAHMWRHYSSTEALLPMAHSIAGSAKSHNYLLPSRANTKYSEPSRGLCRDEGSPGTDFQG
jgi:hypothetical protein